MELIFVILIAVGFFSLGYMIGFKANKTINHTIDDYVKVSEYEAIERDLSGPIGDMMVRSQHLYLGYKAKDTRLLRFDPEHNSLRGFINGMASSYINLCHWYRSAVGTENNGKQKLQVKISSAPAKEQPYFTYGLFMFIVLPAPGVTPKLAKEGLEAFFKQYGKDLLNGKEDIYGKK